MRALIVYESIYGNTRSVAERIAAGLGDRFEATVVAVASVSAADVAGTDLLVCGAPTHVHGLPRPGSRRTAVNTAGKDPSLEVVAGAEDPGVREWLAALDPGDGQVAAAFDTRMRGPAAFTGRASRVIGRRLRKCGRVLAVAPESFLVDKHNRLLPGEADRAEAWARSLAVAAAMSPAHPHR
jgi:hypothetical protein